MFQFKKMVTMLSNEVAIHTKNFMQIRVSDASYFQHAYEIKDFGSTMFQTDRFVAMLRTIGAIHKTYDIALFVVPMSKTS